MLLGGNFTTLRTPTSKSSPERDEKQTGERQTPDEQEEGGSEQQEGQVPEKKGQNETVELPNDPVRAGEGTAPDLPHSQPNDGNSPPSPRTISSTSRFRFINYWSVEERPLLSFILPKDMIPGSSVTQKSDNATIGTFSPPLGNYIFFFNLEIWANLSCVIDN